MSSKSASKESVNSENSGLSQRELQSYVNKGAGGASRYLQINVEKLPILINERENNCSNRPKIANRGTTMLEAQHLQAEELARRTT
jgi:hypothetical protein